MYFIYDNTHDRNRTYVYRLKADCSTIELRVYFPFFKIKKNGVLLS